MDNQTATKPGRSQQDEASLSKEVYCNDNYFSFPLLASLCEQIITIHSLAPQNVLEIGKGNGFLSDFMKRSGMEVTTFDINPALEPDVVGSVTELSDHFAHDQFDVVLCAEVLEHIPFDMFDSALEQIAAVCHRRAVITLPVCQVIRVNCVVDLTLNLGLLNRTVFPSLFWATRGKKISDCHHWEINHSPATSRRNVCQVVGHHFKIESYRRVRHCPYHRMLMLSPQK